MRLKYYIRLLGQMNVKKTFALVVILICIIISSAIYFLKRIAPIIEYTCENTAKSIGVQITEETINELIKNVEYTSLVNLAYNSDGKVIAINANIVNLNKLASNIAYEIQNKLNNLDKVMVKIPIGEVVGLSLFSGYGPSIKIKLVPMGNIKTDFDSNFVSEGINQTKHTINMNVKCEITIVAPFNGKTVSCNNTVTIAETVIVGDIPDTYYNITGIDDVKEEATNLVQ